MAGKTIGIDATEPGKSPGKYERSTIEFPYNDLDDAIEIVNTIHEQAGTECQTHQLAGFMDQSASSGAFRLKLQVARMAGFIEVERGSVRLTDAGRQATESGERAQAMANAFLAIPLYSAIFEKYSGRQLPPAAALQREMEKLGVAPKQTSRARQAFERSAEKAGFYNPSKDRLIQPIVRNGRGKNPDDEKSTPKPPGGGGGDGGLFGLDPLIQGLVTRLPNPGTVWPEVEREKWLTTAKNIFGLIYDDDGSGV